jgi:phosphatidate cytidylyltransferase
MTAPADLLHQSETWLILGSTGGALAFASAIGWALHRRVHGPARRVVENLNARVRSWWLMVVLLASAILLGPMAATVLFAMVSFAALREFITVTRAGPSDHFVLAASFFVVLPAQYVLVTTQWYGLFAIFIPVYAFLILPIAGVLRGDVKNFLARTAEMQWGLMVCVYCVSHLPALMTLKTQGAAGRSAFLLVFILIVAEASDIFQYVWGMLLGRHRIAPAVSPSKTVEGFAGGMLCATGLGALMWRITPFDPLQAAGLALAIAFVGFLGGLVMSAIKRDRGVKDWGNLIEGHGGMLDRLDSLCFAAPIFFHLTRYFFVR